MLRIKHITLAFAALGLLNTGVSVGQSDERAVESRIEEMFGRFTVAGEDGVFTFSVDGDDVVQATMNGETIAGARVEHDDDGIRVFGPDGKLICEMKQNSATGLFGTGGPIDLIGHDGRAQQLMLDGDPFQFSFDPFGRGHAEPPTVMIGVQMREPDAALLGHFDLDLDEATMISRVYPGLPAHKAGVAPFDLVVAIDGKRPAGYERFRTALHGRTPGDALRLTIMHAGKEREVSLDLIPYDGTRLDALSHTAQDLHERLMAEIGDGAAGPFLGLLAEEGAEDLHRIFVQAHEWFPRRLERLMPDEAPTDARVHQRVDSIEARLDRLEQLLEELLDRVPDPHQTQDDDQRR